MNIIVQTTGGYSSSLNGKSGIPNKTLSDITRAIIMNSSHKKYLWLFAYKYAIYLFLQTQNGLCGDILTSYGMDQDLHKNTSKYRMLESTSPMDVLQERGFMIDHIAVILWGIQLLQHVFYTGSQPSLLISTDPIMFGLMNIIIVSPYNTITLQVIYSLNNFLKVLFTIQTSST